jgi:hypothetical protein
LINQLAIPRFVEVEGCRIVDDLDAEEPRTDANRFPKQRFVFEE